MRALKPTLLLLSFSFLFNSHADVMPGDGPYFVKDGEHYQFIFPEEYRSLMPTVVQQQKSLESIYEKSFAWKLDEKTSLVLASNNNQIANAYASVFYNNINFYYNGGASLYDSFAIKSWLYTLLSHEGAHLYQLDPKRGLSTHYHDYLGNSAAPHVFAFVPVFVTPNMLLPTWLLEGNSVLNESRLGNGGRLYSGEEKALFYTLVRSGKLNEARLTNNHLDFPYGHEKYNVGAEFALYLAERFGVDKVNRFFFAHADHYINPFILNYSFEDHFGFSYSRLVVEFLVESEKKAKKQKVSVSPRVVEAPFMGTMNSDDEKIFFLSGDGKTSSRLNIYYKKNKAFESKKLDIPVEKVFEIDKKFYSVSSSAVDQKRYLFSLWDEKNQDLENYRGKIVLDKRGSDLLWFDPKTSMEEPQLYLNEKFYSKAHSSALFDKMGHVYYFKQEGNLRVLYKDKEPLLSFNGYYGKIVEIDEKGKPYFIASTDYGSGLFTFDKGRFYRLVDSDVVVDARHIREGDFLVREFTSEGYEAKVLRISPREEKPASYSYFFEKEATFKTFEEAQQKGVEASESVSSRDYSLLSDLRFGGLNSMILYGNSSLTLNLSGIWSDPLNWNNFILNFARNEYSGEDRYQLSYLNKKNLLQWYLEYSREQYYRGNDNKGYTEKENHDDRPEVGVIWPFFKSGLWTASFQEGISYRSLRDTGVNYAAASFEREKNHALEFYPYSKWSALAEDDRGGDQLRTSALSAEVFQALPLNIFIHGFGVYKETNEDELPMENSIREKTPAILTRGYSLFSSSEKLLKGGRLSLEVGQFFESGIYFSAFPLSLRRLAPKFILNHYYYDLGTKRDFQERGIALDTELLIVHLLPVRVTLATLRREQEAAEFLTSITTQASF